MGFRSVASSLGVAPNGLVFIILWLLKKTPNRLFSPFLLLRVFLRCCPPGFTHQQEKGPGASLPPDGSFRVGWVDFRRWGALGERRFAPTMCETSWLGRRCRSEAGEGGDGGHGDGGPWAPPLTPPLPLGGSPVPLGPGEQRGEQWVMLHGDQTRGSRVS